MKKYLLLLLLPLLSYANIGKITVLKGDVKVKRGSDLIVAKSGTILEKRDFITTAKNAKVQIIFSDKTIFTIGKNSTLDIADYLYDESVPKNNKAKLNVFKGAFSSITGRIGKLNKSKFKLKTKSASIGIRGTVIKANQETIMCTSGAITVTTLNGVSVDVEAGYQTNVSSGTPTQATTINDGDVEKLDVDVYNSEVLDKVQSDISSDNIES
ncbi:MAG: FecR family protein, partial [Campylobacterota bacterium]|nr:FecR family protein [Campylobacterota bacterium]